ncbi:MAG TPA: HepT-like ribonuclease domain-containing protein [Acidimicrobiales bacterium]|nr:HepT-like ribonuclease domain-containing protein [Acidimicrobiales bacterium]
MSRHDVSRLTDIVEAIDAIKDHLTKGDLDDGLVYDAVRVRLIEIGEAVKGVSAELLGTEPEVPWKAIARMRDHLTHRYFDTDHAVVRDVVDNELEPLLDAVRSLSERAEQQVDESQ